MLTSCPNNRYVGCGVIWWVNLEVDARFLWASSCGEDIQFFLQLKTNIRLKSTPSVYLRSYTMVLSWEREWSGKK